MRRLRSRGCRAHRDNKTGFFSVTSVYSVAKNSYKVLCVPSHSGLVRECLQPQKYTCLVS